MAGPLEGYVVMVTRPEEQARGLLDGIAARGGRSVFAPMITIQPAGSAEDRARIRALKTWDILIFISKNAADYGVRLIKAEKQSLEARQVFAVGVGTAGRLHDLGVRDVTAPRSEFSSEGLLKLSGLSAQAVAGRRVLIVRGVGGRELLAHALQQRGATVEYCEVYERRVPDAPLHDILHSHGIAAPDIVIVTSPEALANLAEKIDQEKLEAMYDVPLMVAGARTAQEADRLGFSLEPVVVDNPGDVAILDALVRWATNDA